jgi:hypothetical protein
MLAGTNGPPPAWIESGGLLFDFSDTPFLEHMDNNLTLLNLDQLRPVRCDRFTDKNPRTNLVRARKYVNPYVMAGRIRQGERPSGRGNITISQYVRRIGYPITPSLECTVAVASLSATKKTGSMPVFSTPEILLHTDQYCPHHPAEGIAASLCIVAFAGHQGQSRSI